MWKPERCDVCGECLEACMYLGYDLEKAKKEMAALVAGKPTEVLDKCIGCFACNEYCYKGANPFDLIVHRGTTATPVKLRDTGTVFINTLAAFMPRDVIRKTKKGAPWMSLCAMEGTAPDLFYGSKLFDGLNLVAGRSYFCCNGLLHCRRDDVMVDCLTPWIANLNALPTDEIIFYHDECISALYSFVKDAGLKINFKPVHQVEWLLRVVKENYKDVRKLGIRAAVHLPCSARYGPDRNPWYDELFELLGVERVVRKYDRRKQICCGAVETFQMLTGTPADAEYAEELRKKNLDDAEQAGAEYFVTLCSYCYASMTPGARRYGLKPVLVADIARMSLYDEEPGEYVTIV